MSEPLIGPPVPDKPSEADKDPRRETANHRLAWSLITLWVVALLVTQVSLFLYQPIKPARSEGAEALWLGTMWAGWAVAAWVSTYWERLPLRRIAFILIGLAWSVIGLSTMSGEPPMRYAVMLGSYALVQAILFRWVGVPSWAPSHQRFAPTHVEAEFGGWLATKLDSSESPPGRLLPAQGDIPRPQYGISDLVVITTVIAVLIAIGETYQAKMGVSFWWGLIFAEGMLVATAALGVLCGLSRGSGGSLGWLLALSLVVVGGAAAFDQAEAYVAGQSNSMWFRYGVLLASFAAWIISFTIISLRPSPMDAALETTGGAPSSPP